MTSPQSQIVQRKSFSIVIFSAHDIFNVGSNPSSRDLFAGSRKPANSMDPANKSQDDVVGKIFCRVQRVILAAYFLMMVSGCGFHLRNQHALPPGLCCIKIDSGAPYGDFESSLRYSLSQMGVHVKRYGDAPIAIRIMNITLYQDVPTIGGSNQARVYVYYYEVTFSVLNAAGAQIIPAQTVKTSGTIIINAGTALESTAQLDILKLQMQREASHMIINILNSHQLHC